MKKTEKSELIKKLKKKGYERSRNFLTFPIAGFAYYDGLEVLESLKIGTELLLISEPANRYDENAVAIYYNMTKLGYVPKEKNELLSQLLYFGHDTIFTAKIQQLNPDTHPESQVRVVVKIEDNRE